jgi:hypothetical protein
MMTRAHYRSPLMVAAKAHTALVLFAKIAELAESPELTGYHSATTAILRTSAAAQARCLRDFDRAVAKAGTQAVSDPQGGT